MTLVEGLVEDLVEDIADNSLATSSYGVNPWVRCASGNVLIFPML